jgi:hypothetical protein
MTPDVTLRDVRRCHGFLRRFSKERPVSMMHVTGPVLPSLYLVP